MLLFVGTFQLGAILVNYKNKQKKQHTKKTKQQQQHSNNKDEISIERNEHVLYLSDREVLLTLTNENDQWVAVATCQMILMHEGWFCCTIIISISTFAGSYKLRPQLRCLCKQQQSGTQCAVHKDMLTSASQHPSSTLTLNVITKA